MSIPLFNNNSKNLRLDMSLAHGKPIIILVKEFRHKIIPNNIKYCIILSFLY